MISNSALCIMIITPCFMLLSCKCDPWVQIGSFELTDRSLDFLLYEDVDRLVFLDQDSSEVIFVTDEGYTFKRLYLPTTLLCREHAFDIQYEYYEIDYYEVTFNTIDTANWFLYHTLTTRPVIDSYAEDVFFDEFYVHSQVGKKVCRARLVTDEQKGTVPEQYKQDFIQEPRFIGDTTLYTREFTEVYCGKRNNGRAIYFNTELGVVAMTLDSAEYVVLDRIEY